MRGVWLNMTQRGIRWLLGITWLAAALRFHGLFANRFHADEALFATWARLIAVGRDLLLQGQLVDKPPLQFYLQALFYPLFGPVEWAACMPAFLASILLVPLVALLAWRLYGREFEAIAAAIMVALSPLATQFSATAFIDPLLTFFLTLSLLHSLSTVTRPAGHGTNGNPSHAWSGLFFGLATATKHQAWLFLPLLLAIGIYGAWSRRHWRRWLLPLVAVFSAVLLWELARSGTLAIWSNQLSNYGGLRPAWSWELWPRLGSWLRLWRFTVAQALLFLALPAALLLNRPPPGSRAVEWLLAIYLFTYFWLHWLLAVPAWDRYVLPVVPLVALLLSRGVGKLTRRAETRLSSAADRRNRIGAGTRRWGALLRVETLVLIGLVLVQLPAANNARDGCFPIGGLPTADHGAAAAATLLADAPYGTVLYDHWYSWHWRYHLFDKRVYVSWFPYPEALVDDLRAFGHDGNRRFVALPRGDQSRPVKRAVNDAGFRLHTLSIPGPGQIDLFHITPAGESS